jgi:hypothetical protein
MCRILALLLAQDHGDPKICQQHATILGQHDIARRDLRMYEAKPMGVGQSCAHLLEDRRRHPRAQG